MTSITGRAAVLAPLCLITCTAVLAQPQEGLPAGVTETRIPLDQPLPESGGGFFAHDLDGDGARDLVVTSEGHIGAYTVSGERLWVHETAIYLWDYTHHPSAIAGDLDGDGAQEIAYLTPERDIAILDAATGEPEKTLEVGGEAVAIAIADLRGEGDRDILVQYSQTEVAAIRADTGELLWETGEYKGIEHSPLRQADLDGDGLDEVAGAAIIDHDGSILSPYDLGDTYRSMDSIVIADVVPGLPLEVGLAEQRGANSHTVVVAPDHVVFRTLNPWDWEDPDKLAIGDFDAARPGLEVFNRSSGGDGTTPRGDDEEHASEEAPWVLDATGELLSKYYVNDRKPDWWTGHGIEEICRLDWDGDAVDELVGKERHKNGAGCIFDALTGKFRVVFPARAMLIYAADMLGDSREEVAILDASGTLRVLSNAAPNPHPERPSPWAAQHYARQKQNWNYYSP